MKGPKRVGWFRYGFGVYYVHKAGRLWVLTPFDEIGGLGFAEPLTAELWRALEPMEGG